MCLDTLLNRLFSPFSLLLNLMHVLYREGYLLISETVCFLSKTYEITGNTPTGLSFQLDTYLPFVSQVLPLHFQVIWKFMFFDDFIFPYFSHIWNTNVVCFNSFRGMFLKVLFLPNFIEL